MLEVGIEKGATRWSAQAFVATCHAELPTRRASDAGALDARGDREVALTIGHEAQHGLRIGVDDAHFYVGVLCSELADGVDDVDAPRYEDRCDADRPPKQSLDSVYGVAGPFGVLHCGPRGP